MSFNKCKEFMISLEFLKLQYQFKAKPFHQVLGTIPVVQTLYDASFYFSESLVLLIRFMGKFRAFTMTIQRQ